MRSTSRVPRRNKRNQHLSHVAPVHRKPAALIVDDDVGLIFWVGEIFVRAGWNIVPALNCRQAVSLAVMWDSHINLILVNSGLGGISEMVETLSDLHRPKVVVIRDPNVEPEISADAIVDRPGMETPLARLEWAQRFQKLLKELIQ